MKKCCRVKSIYHERYDPMVFWEAGKVGSILRHDRGNINTGYPYLLQNLLRNENILNINIWNQVASLLELSSQNSIVSLIHGLYFAFDKVLSIRCI